MKQVFATLLFLSAVHFGWSQMEMKLKPRFSIQKTDSLVFKRPPLLTRNPQLLNPDNFRFSHSVSLGSIYTLPQDNMPCFRPDTSLVYNMPMQTVPGNSNMPNGYLHMEKDALIQLLRKKALE